jgi:extracellular elastinolytic metalloproteinase
LNIFYYCNFMHDFLYLLGFREKDGNFQQEKLRKRRPPGRQGGCQGPLRSSLRHCEHGNARRRTRACDEHGAVTSTNRHTAMDSSVVFHEYTHGLTNRLVGGPMNDAALDAPQSSGMGEGWSDYVACTINNTEVVGDWVVNNPDGIREFHYDSNFPDNFGNIGTGRYDEEHNIGEIWCAILMEMKQKVGKELSLQWSWTPSS